MVFSARVGSDLLERQKAAVSASCTVNCWGALGHMPSDNVLNKLAMQLVLPN